MKRTNDEALTMIAEVYCQDLREARFMSRVLARKQGVTYTAFVQAAADSIEAAELRAASARAREAAAVAMLTS